MGLEQDLYFKPSHSLSLYAEAARQHGAITDDARLLDATQDRRQPPLKRVVEKGNIMKVRTTAQ